MTREHNEPIDLRRVRRRIGLGVFVAGVAAIAAVFVANRYRGTDELLNVSYDATREYFAEIGASYARNAAKVRVQTSHAGSVRQVRSVVRGFKADMVTLASATDIDEIVAETSLIDARWRDRFPHGSSPFFSTIVFLVRAGNPKKVRDWDDLARPDVRVIAPSPKVSGAGRYAYLAAWAYALEKGAGSEARAERFVTSVYEKSPVLDEGARGALVAFIQREQAADVLLTWENEAWHALREFGRQAVELVYPPRSIKAEPVVAIVDRHAAERGTTDLAVGYLNYLFSPEGQETAARHYLRPRDAAVAARHADQFPRIELFEYSSVFGPWRDTVRKHFGAGGVFDRIYSLEQLKRRPA